MIPALDTRQVAILTALLESDRPIPAPSLAAELGISARAVRYNLPILEFWLARRGVRLVSLPRLGTLLEAPEAIRKSLLAELGQQEALPRMTPYDRLQTLLFELLSSTTYMTGSELSGMVGVSRGTLTRVLDAAREWVVARNLDLQIRPHVGTSVVGDEMAIRHALIGLLLEYGLGSALLALCLWDARGGETAKPAGPAGARNILKKVEAWRLPEGWRFVTRLERDLSITLADDDHLYLALYLALTLKRNLEGRFAPPPAPDRALFLRSLPEHAAVQALAARLKSERGQQLGDSEMAHLALEVLTLPREGEPASSPPIKLATLDEAALLPLVAGLARSVSAKLGCGAANPDILQRMTRHVARVALRIQSGLPLPSRFSDDVLGDYSAVYDATREALGALEGKLRATFPPQEVAMLAIYLALAFDLTLPPAAKRSPRIYVVCPSGGVTLSMLLSRLRAEMPDLKVVGVDSIRNLGRIDANAADAIISTAPVSSPQLPVLVVSPLLPASDVAKIRQALGPAKPTPQRPDR